MKSIPIHGIDPDLENKIAEKSAEYGLSRNRTVKKMLGELFTGFHRGDRFSSNKQELKRFLSKDGVKIIDVTMETSEIFGEIKASLRRSVKMIPLNDIWIAAHAVETGSKLVTCDSHFRQIAGLRLWEELKR
ncbi:MAG: PIN domain-containing protein [Acidobacteria bacterium]|nr:PIN domain-containing protein [Acidobacteriota bacterium]